jgi:5-hydroxyisourate hydrolase-like protein (transthyretin family)
VSALAVRLLIFPLVLATVSLNAHAPDASSHDSAQKRPSPKPRVQYDDYQVPAGTPLIVRLRTALDSASAAPEDAVRGTLIERIGQGGVELIPKGSTLHGRTTDVVRASKENRTGRVVLEFHVIEHIETRSLATIQTRGVRFEATLAPKEKFRDVRVPADERLVVTLASPLQVHIPRAR